VGGLALRLEPVDLTQLAQAAADRLGREAPRQGIHVVETGRVVVRGDPEQLEDVLAHLIDNAVRYSPQGGDVDASLAERNGFGVVSVRDYGVGIPWERQRRIFERFYRAHVGTPYDYGGLGVALYLSKQIVTRQGGQMWFESEEGKGSTFYFSLPLAEEQTRG
jgi:signal transduction histidine kinase